MKEQMEKAPGMSCNSSEGSDRNSAKPIVANSNPSVSSTRGEIDCASSSRFARPFVYVYRHIDIENLEHNGEFDKISARIRGFVASSCVACTCVSFGEQRSGTRLHLEVGFCE